MGSAGILKRKKEGLSQGALGMSTGAEHCRRALEALGAAVDGPHALPGAPWRVSGHSTSHSDSSSSTVDMSVRFCTRARIAPVMSEDLDWKLDDLSFLL